MLEGCQGRDSFGRLLRDGAAEMSVKHGGNAAAAFFLAPPSGGERLN